jgi:ABC-type spermidine/putrescine transport system permease subunit II
VDWFTALEAPTQVAIIGVVTAIVAAASGVAIAIVNNRRTGGGKAEIAAMTIDAAVVHEVSAAVEALNLTLIEQNKVGDRLIIIVKGMTDEMEELRREVRALTDKMRARP